tara:strand:+ start:80 stop:1012 length:933 start_codon:yes stop_codon:yes gene_type:complete
MINNGSTKTASQQAFTVGQTDVPGNPKYYLRHVVTSSSSNANSVFFDQHIENVRTLSGKTVTLSFYAKADSNKSIATEFAQYFGSGGSPSSFNTGIGVNTHNLTTSWQKFTVTVAIPHLTDTELAGGNPKTIGTDGTDTIDILFWLDAGSDFNSRTNSLGQQSGTFDIAQVQLEEGTVATPFEHRPIGTELALCQRYFERINGTDTSIGTGSNYNNSQFSISVKLSVEKRTDSIAVSTSADGGTLFTAYGTNAIGGNFPWQTISPTINKRGNRHSVDYSHDITGSSAGGPGTAIMTFLRNGQYIDISAEL